MLQACRNLFEKQRLESFASPALWSSFCQCLDALHTIIMFLLKIRTMTRLLQSLKSSDTCSLATIIFFCVTVTRVFMILKGMFSDSSHITVAC